MLQGFGSKEAQVLASVRRDQELLPCWTESVSCGSKTDLLLPKAKPISDASGSSAVTY